MRLAILYGIVVAVIWGAQPVVSKFGYRASMTAEDLTFLRYAASGFVMLPFMMMRKDASTAFGLGWGRAAVLTLLAGPLYSLVLIGGLAWAPASHGALIYPAMTPVFSLILARVVLGRSEPVSVMGLSLLVAGVVAIGLANAGARGAAAPDQSWRGDALFVVAALMWAFYIVLIRKWNADPLVVVGIVQVGGLVYLPLYLAAKGLSVFQLETREVALQAVYHGIVVSILAVTLFNLSIRQLGARASMFTALVPLFGVALSVSLLNESASLQVIAGTAAIVAGLAWSLASRGPG